MGALQLPANERAGYLSETCHDDIELHHRVATLLEAHERAGAFLQTRLISSQPRIHWKPKW